MEQDTMLYYLKLAYEQALRSYDLSSQNGAVIAVHGTRSGSIYGYNNIPAGVEVTKERLQRPLKYAYTEHAERAAVYEAAKTGMTLQNATMYCPWAACTDCARAIICSGIKKVVVHKERMDLTTGTWLESVNMALGMLKEAGVTVEYAAGAVVGAPMIRVDGQLWSPETLKFAQ